VGIPSELVAVKGRLEMSPKGNLLMRFYRGDHEEGICEKRRKWKRAHGLESDKKTRELSTLGSFHFSKQRVVAKLSPKNGGGRR